jgi:hypothetical protein
MQIHMKRKHQDESWSVTAGNQPSSFPNQREAATSSQYMYGPPFRLNTIAGKNEESILDKNLETLRRFMEFKRLSNELERTLKVDSVVSDIAKSLMIQMISNPFSGKGSMPIKKEVFPTGYQILNCDNCLSGCSLRSVFLPIEIEFRTKPVHKCNHKNLFVGHNEDEKARVKRQAKDLLEDYLSSIVRSRISQRDVYLKTVKLSRQAFSDEGLKRLEIPANKIPIEESDSIKINLPCDTESTGYYWFCRAIREDDKNNSTKISQNELKEFVSVTKSTFAVFADIVRKDYFLIYLVL